MKFSDHAERELLRRRLDRSWVEQTVDHPEFVVTDPADSTVLHAFRRIEALEGRWLRVVYAIRGGEILVITAFPDRDAEKYR